MKFDKEAVIRSMELQPQVFANYVESISQDALDVRRLASAWTLREHIYHVAEAQDLLLARIRKIRAETQPVITPHFPDKDGSFRDRFSSVADAVAHYKRRRAEQLDEIRALTDADFAKPAEHPEYAQYNLGILIHHMLFHEYWHLYRIEELWLTRDEYLTEVE